MGVLKDLAVKFLQKYVGSYLDVPADFDFSLLKGKVELNNVALKKDALDLLGLPLFVKSGLVGRLLLLIPLTNLKSQPTVIVVENVVLIANFKEWSQAEFEKANSLKKTRQLELDELGSSTGETEDEEGGTLKKLLAQILNNLQITVTNVTIRLEDNTGRIPYSIGLNLDQLMVHSTDHTFQQGAGAPDPESPVFFKLANLHGLSVFCVPSATDISAEPAELFKALFGSKIEPQHYLMRPINAVASLAVQKSFFPKDGAPIFDVQVQFEVVEFSIYEKQLKLILQAVESLHYREFYPFSSLRPKLSIQADPSAWWHYALMAVTKRLRQKRRYLFYTKEYVKYCRMKALAMEEKVVHKATRLEAETQLAKLEALLPYEEIAAARSLAARQQDIDRKALEKVLYQGKTGRLRTLGQRIKNQFNDIRLTDQDFQVSEEELQSFLAEFSLTPEEKKVEVLLCFLVGDKQ